MVDLFRFRQKTLFHALLKQQAALKKQGKNSYDILMRETSDLMQDLALAYGERMCLESCIDSLPSFKHQGNRKVMELVYRVFAVDAVKRDLGWYLAHGAISKAAGSSLIEAQKDLVKKVPF